MESLYRPEQVLSFPGGLDFQISRQSAHKGGKLVSPMQQPSLPLVNVPSTRFCSRLSRPQSNIAAGRILSMKNSSDTTGNRPRDPPACSAVPQPTPPPSKNPVAVQYAISFFSHYCLPLRIKYLLNTAFSNKLSLYFSSNLRDKRFTLTYSNRQN